VDKPNATLCSERRGTLSYPELDSFILKDRKKSGRATKKQQYGEEKFSRNDLELDVFIKQRGTRSRPKKN
jgi:hypothetical protein